MKREIGIKREIETKFQFYDKNYKVKTKICIKQS